jgi:membrane-bound serine protease (ClpP class)
MYPFVWRAYDTGGSTGPNRLIGRTGIVKERLAPAGYILVDNELWRAEVVRGKAPLEVGEKVKVIEASGLTLLVEPEGNDM